MIINHNLGSMNAQRNMGINSANASKSMEKLSSGLRINRAGDDAAGLAISEKMRGQIRGLDQASANAQDGISMIQTGEGALSETHSILQRMRELAVQSSNDTNVAVDRGEIQKEMDELAKEVTRISNSTEFNTQKLINGAINDTTGIKSSKFHIGANANQDITLSINAMDAKSLGISRDVSSATVDTVNTAKVSSAKVDGVDVAKTLAAGNYNVTVASQLAGATSATSTSTAGTIATGATTGTAIADTSVTLSYSSGAGVPSATKTGTVTIGTDTVTGTSTADTNVVLTYSAATGTPTASATGTVTMDTDPNYGVVTGTATAFTSVTLTSTAAAGTVVGTGSVTIDINATTGAVTGAATTATSVILTRTADTAVATKGALDTVDITDPTAVTGAATAATSVTLTRTAGAAGANATIAAAQAGTAVGDTLAFDSGANSAQFNGITIELTGVGQNGDPTATWDSVNDKVVVSLDSTTPANNTAAKIEAAIQGLTSQTKADATTVDFSTVTVAGAGTFAGAGAVFADANTFASAAFASGLDAAADTWVTAGATNGLVIDDTKFTGATVGDVVTITAGAPTWEATGDLSGTISGATNAINGLNIDTTKLTTSALGDTVTVTGAPTWEATGDLSGTISGATNAINGLNIDTTKLTSETAGAVVTIGATTTPASWTATGDLTGAISGATNAINGLNIDVTKLTGAADGATVTIAATTAPGWTATGDITGAISGASNVVNGMNIDITKLSGFNNGDSVTMTGTKDATATAQLFSVTAAGATSSAKTGTVAVGANFLTGTASADTAITLTRTAGTAATTGAATVGTAAAAATVTTGGTLNLKIDGIAVATTIADGGTKATVIADINAAANTALGTTGQTYASFDGSGKLNVASLTTGATSQTEVVSAMGPSNSILADLKLSVGAGTAGNAATASSWVASGDTTGTKADTGVVSLANGISADMSKLTGMVDGDTVTITGTGSASSTVAVGSAVAVNKATGGTYTIGDTTTGQAKVTFAAGQATTGSATITVATSEAEAAVKQSDNTMSDAAVSGGINVSTQASASSAITTIQSAIEMVSAERSKLGAYQNRLEHTIANLGTSSENLTSAESRIRDVDMAKEMSAFSKNNILSQAAQAMLAQANQQPQQVLQLLR